MESAEVAVMAGASLQESIKHATLCSRNPLSLTVPRAEIRNCVWEALSATRTNDPFLVSAQRTKNPFLLSTQREGRTRKPSLFHTCATSSQATTLSDTAVPVAPRARTPPFHILITGSSKGVCNTARFINPLFNPIQCDGKPAGTNSSANKKRKRQPAETVAEEPDDFKLQLYSMLETSSRVLTAHVESQNANSQLDRNQRKEHMDSLVSVLGKLADAVGKLAERL